MIGKLRGKVDSIFDDSLILDVNDVGYSIFCSSKILATIKIGQELELIIETIVREDAIILFGFLNANEKNCFNILCKVSGIGNKMAVKLMSALTIDEIVNAIESEDSKTFCRAPGVGQKIASRIIIELKNIGKSIHVSGDPAKINSDNYDNKDSRISDALSALENLGYQRNIVRNVVCDILKERNDIVIESLITEALKRINNF